MVFYPVILSRYVDNLPAGYNLTKGLLSFENENNTDYESGIPIGNQNDVNL